MESDDNASGLIGVFIFFSRFAFVRQYEKLSEPGAVRDATWGLGWRERSNRLGITRFNHENIEARRPQSNFKAKVTSSNVDGFAKSDGIAGCDVQQVRLH